MSSLDYCDTFPTGVPASTLAPPCPAHPSLLPAEQAKWLRCNPCQIRPTPLIKTMQRFPMVLRADAKKILARVTRCCSHPAPSLIRLLSIYTSLPLVDWLCQELLVSSVHWDTLLLQVHMLIHSPSSGFYSNTTFSVRPNMRLSIPNLLLLLFYLFFLYCTFSIYFYYVLLYVDNSLTRFLLFIVCLPF